VEIAVTTTQWHVRQHRVNVYFTVRITNSAVRLCAAQQREYGVFYVLLTVHLGIVFVNNQLDKQFFFMYVHFYSLHVSGSHMPIIRRINCINTLVYVTLYKWHLVCILNDHLYWVTYTRCRVDTINSDDGHVSARNM